MRTMGAYRTYVRDAPKQHEGHTVPMQEHTPAEEQQELILEDSELRVVNGRTPPGNDDVERRTSDEATPPPDVPEA
jgi:hypothetical protein